MFELKAEQAYERLDTFISESLGISRTKAQKLIRTHGVKYSDERELKPSTAVAEGQTFKVRNPVDTHPAEGKSVTPEDIPFDVLYEDEHLIVINKPSGLVVHPAPGNWEHTLVNALVYRFPDMRMLTNWLRPGIVHRLDAPTSGVMMVARSDRMTLELQKIFAERRVRKTYLAIAHNAPEKYEGVLSGPIDRDPDVPMKMAVVEGGKPSLTGYRVLWEMRGHSLIECRLFTGRMHQIRVHLSSLGCPLVGDTMYGAQAFGDEFTGRIYLHSWQLEFRHPATGKELKFRQPVPHDFRGMIARIKLGA